MPIETSVDEFVLDGPATLQLRIRATDGDDAVLASTVWRKQAPLTLDATLLEEGDDEELAAAAERASVAAVDVEHRYRNLSTEPRPDFEYPAPDRDVVYVDGSGGRHDL